MKQLKPPLRNFYHDTRAFSLIEVALVLAIIGIMAGVSLPMLGILLKKQTFSLTQANMEATSSALILYAQENGRLPCPAATQYIEDGRNAQPIGAEIGSGLKGDEPPKECKQFTGLVPYRTIGIAPDKTFDGWNRPLSYTVTPVFTGSKKLVSLLPEEGEADEEKADLCAIELGEEDEKIEVLDAQNLSLSPNSPVAFLLVSHGQNGDGSFLSEGSGQRQPVLSPLERSNADRDLQFIYRSYRQDPVSGYDDILLWRTLPQIATAFGGKLCGNREKEPEDSLNPDELNQNDPDLMEQNTNNIPT